MHVIPRRLAAGAAGAALAVTGLVAAPAAHAVPTTSVVGLYGTTDPTYNGVYRQSLAILGLHAAGRTPRPEAVQWLLSQQCADGSFTSYSSTATCQPFDPITFTGGADSNATAMAVQALLAVGTPAAKAAAAKAAAYLASVQLSDGSWEFNPGNSGSGDPNSTGLVLLALNAAGLTPAHDAAGYLAGLQVGRPDISVAGAGGISTPWAAGTPDRLATVQAVPGLRGATLSSLPDPTTAWQDGPTVYATLPPATAAGVGGWAAAWLAGEVSTQGAPAYAAANETVAAWTVLSLAADRTAETTARALEADIEALPATTSPAANGQDALAAAAVGRTAAAGTYADRIAASLTRDTAAPTTTWSMSTTSLVAGVPLVLTRTSLSDGFWPTSRLVVVVSWGDGSATRLTASTTRVSHRYFAAGSHTVRATAIDPSGNRSTTTVGTVTVRPDVVAPTASVIVPANPTARSSWATVKVSATDVGSGVATVKVRIAERRAGVWYSWTGTRWVAGVRAWVTATHVAGTHRWVVAAPHLTLGRMSVSARAVDRAGLISPLSTVLTTLRS